MREIRFREWDDLNGEMHLAWHPRFKVDGYTTELLQDGKVMQFTGLHDKNGKEIYEGDVVRDLRFSKHNIHEIQFGEGGEGEPADYVGGYIGWCMGNGETTGFTSGRELEVIGNIYENPELLNRE